MWWNGESSRLVASNEIQFYCLCNLSARLYFCVPLYFANFFLYNANHFHIFKFNLLSRNLFQFILQPVLAWIRNGLRCVSAELTSRQPHLLDFGSARAISPQHHTHDTFVLCKSGVWIKKNLHSFVGASANLFGYYFLPKLYSLLCRFYFFQVI